MKEKIKILIADDNLDFVSALITYFDTQSDVEIIATAKDGYEAYDKIIEEKPKVVLLDLIMPNLDGLGVLEKIISSNIEMPLCVMLSAVGQESITAQAINLGAQYYVLKPFDMDVLMKRIREMIETPQKKKPVIPMKTIELKPSYIPISAQTSKEELLEIKVTKMHLKR